MFSHVLNCVLKVQKKLLSKKNSSKYKVGPAHSDGLGYTRGLLTQWESCPTITARNPDTTEERGSIPNCTKNWISDAKQVTKA